MNKIPSPLTPNMDSCIKIDAGCAGESTDDSEEEEEVWSAIVDKIDAKILNWVKGFDVEKLIFFSDLCTIFSIIFSIFRSIS